MPLKKAPPPSGAPDWVLTYGDLMSLLLCFFILLAAMANYDKQDKRMMAALESIREALGSPGQDGWVTAKELDLHSVLVQLQSLAAKIIQKNNSVSDDPGVTGRYCRVLRLRDGLEVMVGGPIAFAPNEARLAPDADLMIQEIAKGIRGHRNRVEVRGHASIETTGVDRQYIDPVTLSYQRARAVYERLVELQIEPDRIRILAAGPHEPIRRINGVPVDPAEHRRVEIIVQQSTVDQYRTAELGVEPGEDIPTPEDAAKP